MPEASNEIAQALRSFVEQVYERVEMEAQRAADPNWKYEQMWLMSQEGWDSLPESPTVFDIMAAGGVCVGWHWVRVSDAAETA